MNHILPFAEWPEADQVMWRHLVEPGGPFDDHGALSHLRPTSLRMREGQYGRWLAWLGANDPTALDAPPTSRATMDRLARWVSALSSVSPVSRQMFVSGTLHVLRMAAPDADWTLHMKLDAKLRLAAGRGSQERKLGRVLSSARLLEAGLRHATHDAEMAPTALVQAKCRRDGAMVAMLALLPMRRRAFASLRIGSSLLLQGDEIFVVLTEELTKTGVHWETPAPMSLVPVLRLYLEEARPLLMARGGARHDYLWVGELGLPYVVSSVGVRIETVTERLTGVRVPPHFFRDAAATTLARISSESARLTRPLLAHSGFKTAERHYNQAQGIEAGRAYAAVVAELKRKGR